ncbi:nitrate/nitrite transporter [Oceanobacillus sp. J11TS1]|uniref:MFS transporter n=1 Tax=Oceanobacillus sp. J11TS1 TaxID=2807191 RepID=UPI001B262755|nr:MFS transporter [Oceanobacillus sp. J11TS1]GIO24104.1 MFS transporter [Oceanobacillus sp. J11TS1]
MESNSTIRGLKDRIAPLFFLSAAVSIVNILFLPIIFYVPFQKVFELTNEQMGTLLAAYASLAVPGYVVGGWLSDKFSGKTLVTTSVLSTSILGFWMATIPSYQTLLIIFFLMSITLGLFLWSAQIKCLRMLGDNSEQGKIFGFSMAIDGAISVILCIGLAYLVGGSIETVAGFRIIILTFSIFFTIIGIGIYFFYDYKKYSAKQDPNALSDRITLKSLLTAIKMPVTWIIAIISFGVYVESTALSYMSPYLNLAYEMPAAWAAIFAAIVRYGIKIVAAPAGGLIRDKIGRTAPLVYSTVTPAIIIILVLAFIPRNPDYLVLAIVLAFAAIFFSRLSYTAANMPLAELKAPIALAGTITGLALMLGYSSDLFLPTLIGHLLDAHGVNGFNYVFAIMIAGMCIMLSGVFWLNYEGKKLRESEQAEALSIELDKKSS